MSSDSTARLQLAMTSNLICTSTVYLAIAMERCLKMSTSPKSLSQSCSHGLRMDKTLCWKKMVILAMDQASQTQYGAGKRSMDSSSISTALHHQILLQLRTAGSQQKCTCASFHIGMIER